MKKSLNDDIDRLKQEYMETVGSIKVNLDDNIDFRSSVMLLVRALRLLNEIEAKQQRLFFMEMHRSE